MAARSIQIVDRQKMIQLMQKECLAERKAEIYRTLLMFRMHWGDPILPLFFDLC
jgi:hypothetical protein